MRTLIRSLGRDGRTVVLSSHLMGEVEQICRPRRGHPRTGALVAEGTVDELRGRAGLRVRAQPLDAAARCSRRPGVESVPAAGGGTRRHRRPAASPPSSTARW